MPIWVPFIMRAFSLCFFCVDVICVGSAYHSVMPRMAGVMFLESACPFTVTVGYEMDSCLFGVIRVIEDFCGDVDFMF